MTKATLLRPNEVGELIGASHKHVIRLILSGELSAHDISLHRKRREFRVSMDAIDTFLAGRKIERPERPAPRTRAVYQRRYDLC